MGVTEGDLRPVTDELVASALTIYLEQQHLGLSSAMRRALEYARAYFAGQIRT